MTALLPEIAAALPTKVQLDGELVAYGSDGLPDFHRLSARMLHGDCSVPVTHIVFGVLGVEGLATTAQPYTQRRALLETLDLERPGVQVVAKRERDPYGPGERRWVKTKNKTTARFAEERAALGRRATAGRA